MSDFHLERGHITYVFYSILVERRYSRVKVSHKLYYDESKRRYFKSLCPTFVGTESCHNKTLEKTFLFELYFCNENLGNKINKNN